MFAVSGWKVDAALLKPQTESFKTAKTSLQNDEQPGEKPSRKRKREQNAAAVGTEDVTKLWEKHVEGRENGKIKAEKRKQRKLKKLEEPLPDGKEAETQNLPQQAESADAAALLTGEKEANLQVVPKKNKKGKGRPVEETSGHAQQADSTKSNGKASAVIPIVSPPLPAGAKLTPMQAAMRQKLVSARFRHLNETLYTAPSSQAQELFSSNPDMFVDYHAGFRQQVAVWPENPVDKFIAMIRKRGAVRLPSQKKAFKSKSSQNSAQDMPAMSVAPLPRTQSLCTIADLGCGDARLQQTLVSSNDLQKMALKVLSYDLHSPSASVIKADISSLPLAEGSVDVAICCLALMGTNWVSFIEEAYRVLHWKGELWIAEIKSRFGRAGKKSKVVEHSVGNKMKRITMAKAQEAKKREQEETTEQDELRTEVDGVQKPSQETDVGHFVDVLKRRGFVLKEGDNSIDLSNKMFVLMEFVKAATPVKGKGVPEGADGKTKRSASTAGGEQEEVATDDETKTLKPCLYKIR